MLRRFDPLKKRRREVLGVPMLVVAASADSL